MPDYQASTVNGSSWVRAKKIVIENPINQTPYIMFSEEKVLNTNEGVFPVHLNRDLIQFFTEENQSTQFNIISPIDGSILATATYADVYTMLYSVYMHLAMQKDAEIAGGE